MKIKINESQMKLLKLQRTYLLKEKDPGQAYQDNLESEFKMLEEHLPAGDFNIMDIGCGMAGIDLMIYRHRKCNMLLIDKNEVTDGIYYGMSEKPCSYSNLVLMLDFLKSNGVNPEHMCISNADNPPYCCPLIKFDVIISLIACGFHFSVTKYLKFILSSLKPDGVLILDIRDNTGQEIALREFFNNETVIRKYDKYKRLKYWNMK